MDVNSMQVNKADTPSHRYDILGSGQHEEKNSSVLEKIEGVLGCLGKETPKIRVKLSFHTFFSYLMFYPQDAKTKGERRLATISAIACAIFSFGLCHLICAYVKSIKPPEASFLISKGKQLDSEQSPVEQVKSLAAELIKINSMRLDVNLVSPGLTSGGSGQPVYLIRDKETNKLLLVVKSMPLSHADNEIENLLVMEQLKSRRYGAPHIVGIGLTKETTFLALSPAQGLSIETYFKAFQNPAENREKAMENASYAIKSAAKGIASLHSQKPYLKEANKKQLIEARENLAKGYKKTLKENAEALRSNIDPTTLKWLQTLAEKEDLFNLNDANYVHGDFHPGNVFFDPHKKPPITLIDLDMFGESFSKKIGVAPIGRGSYDFIYFQVWLIVMGMQYQLSKDEIHVLQSDFENAYFNQMGMTEDERNIFKIEAQFMDAFLSARYLLGLLQASNSENHPWKHALGNQMPLFIDFLRERLNRMPSLEAEDIVPS